MDKLESLYESILDKEDADAKKYIKTGWASGICTLECTQEFIKKCLRCDLAKVVDTLSWSGIKFNDSYQFGGSNTPCYVRTVTNLNNKITIVDSSDKTIMSGFSNSDYQGISAFLEYQIQKLRKCEISLSNNHNLNLDV